jgi:hypothetical protein
MSDKRELAKIKEKYAEAILFQDIIINELNFNSVGEFVELVGGVFGMLNVNNIDNAKRISEAFAVRIGYILDKIGYVDKIIENNKSMRDYYEEQQKLIKEKEEKVEKKKVEENTVFIDTNPDLANLVKREVKYVGAGWYLLPDGNKVRGKQNIPEGFEIVNS